MEEEVEDIAGVRIICQFEEDIETVACSDPKKNSEYRPVKSEKNYLKHIKQSGYRSYHHDHLLYRRYGKGSEEAAGWRFRSVRWQ